MAQFKLERLVQAIQIHEGWHVPGEQGFPEGSISYRQNNPGNLRASPYCVEVRGGYCIFKDEASGLFALKWDLISKAKGNTSTGLNGESTLRDLIAKYAPKEDQNDPASYLAEVVRTTGLSPEMRLKELLAP